MGVAVAYYKDKGEETAFFFFLYMVLRPELREQEIRSRVVVGIWCRANRCVYGYAGGHVRAVVHTAQFPVALS